MSGASLGAEGALRRRAAAAPAFGGGEPVITRVGLVSAAGIGAAAGWEALEADPAPPAPLDLFDVGPGAAARQVPGWDPVARWNRRTAATSTRSTQFALAAAEEILAGLDEAETEALGVVLGTGFSTVHNFHKVLDEPDYMTPLKFLSTLPSSAPTNLSIACRMRGISTAVSSSVAGLEALLYGAELVRDGYTGAVLAGGAEELSRDLWLGLCRAGSLPAPGGRRGGRALGVALGEGAGLVLVESEEAAVAAGREPLAKLAGWGEAWYDPARDRRGEAAERAMAAALEMAGLDAAELDAVLVGANGGPLDRGETAALERLFPAGVPPCLALKGWLGESFGAFGASAVAAACLALAAGRLPGAPGRAATRSEGGDADRLHTILIHDFGWDGNHAAVVLTAHHPRCGATGESPGPTPA